VYRIRSDGGDAETTVLNRLVAYGDGGDHWDNFAKWAAAGGRLLLDNVAWNCDLRRQDSESCLIGWLLYLTDQAFTRVAGSALRCRRLPNRVENFLDSGARVVLEGLPSSSAWLIDDVVEAYHRAAEPETPKPPENEVWLTGMQAFSLGVELLGDDAPALVTIGRHKAKLDWRPGRGRTKYEVERKSFKEWLGAWNLDRLKRSKGM
jgi:hypothetical protein